MKSKVSLFCSVAAVILFLSFITVYDIEETESSISHRVKPDSTEAIDSTKEVELLPTYP